MSRRLEVRQTDVCIDARNQDTVVEARRSIWNEAVIKTLLSVWTRDPVVLDASALQERLTDFTLHDRAQGRLGSLLNGELLKS